MDFQKRAERLAVRRGRVEPFAASAWVIGKWDDRIYPAFSSMLSPGQKDAESKQAIFDPAPRFS